MKDQRRIYHESIPVYLLHARPAAILATECIGLKSSVTIESNGMSASGNDVIARLMSFPQVVVTSHQAFFTREALQAIAADTLGNARNFLQGLPYGKAEVVR